MEEDLKVKATELGKEFEEIAVRWLLCWPLPQEYFYS